MSDINKLLTEVKEDLDLFGTTRMDNITSLITTIESQKEEIENKRDLILTSNKMYTEISLRESDLNDEIESLKAITELAVKIFHEIATSQTSKVIDLRIKAGVAISEIERLQNDNK